MISSTPKTFADFEALLAARLPGYESRPQQQQLAAFVETALADGRVMLGEAGTGTGKSLAYLVPAALSGKRVIVSTATKALQDQLLAKDLPFLEATLGEAGVRLSHAVLKGRSNYLCGQRARMAAASGSESAARIVRAAEGDPGFGGERESLPFQVSAAEWMEVCAESKSCRSLKCRNGDDCWAERARRAAKNASLVVVNHAVYFRDLLLNGAMLGEHDAVIFDEAHELEDWATSALERTIKDTALVTLQHDVGLLAKRMGLAMPQLGEAMVLSDDMWATLEPGRIKPPLSARVLNLCRALRSSADVIRAMRRDYSDLYSTDEALNHRCDELADRALGLADVMEEADDPESGRVLWVEVEEGRKVFKTAPIEVAPFLSSAVFGGCAVCVSATLAVRGSFQYIRSRLGIKDALMVDVGTPFDFNRQSGFFASGAIPDPQASPHEWSRETQRITGRLVDLSRGRALLLYTSWARMREAADALRGRIPYQVLVQGELPNRDLAREFERDTHSVLFATKSFFTGVDFQGETLTMVVIDRMPFPRPDEPMAEARGEAIKRRGGSDFAEYMIPVATLTLRQAYGRLIRHRSDFGVVAVLDPRLVNKQYGRQMCEALPDSKWLASLPEVEDFLETEPAR